MHKLIFIISIVFSVSVGAEENFYGTYIQETPGYITESQESERKDKALEKFESMKITFTISEQSLIMFLAKEKVMELPYKLHGQTIVATEDDEYHIVLYIKDSNSIYGTAQKYNKVQ